MIIPAHNEEEHIGNVLRAICSQRYPDFEVIVVDNASTDRTAEVARSFPVKVIHEPKKGTHHARERGRREVKGDIIVNIDADCVPDPDWLQKGATYFTNPKVVAVTGPCDYADASFFLRNILLITQKYIYPIITAIFQLPFIRKGAVMMGGNVFIRHSALHEIGGYDTSFVFRGDDVDTAKRLLKHGRVLFKNNIMIKTSFRRFKKEGLIKASALYIFHFFRVTLSKSKEKIG